MKKVILLTALILSISLLFPSRITAAVNCPENSLSSLNVIVPPSINRSQPSGIRFVSLPAEYRGERIFLRFFQSTQSPLANEFPIAVTIDSSGNADLSTQTLGQLLPTIPEGTYTVRVQGGPIITGGNGQPVVTTYPTCLQLSSAVQVSGGAPTCKNLGDTCNPQEPLNLCPQVSAGFCDTSQNPPRLRLPDLKPVILDNARCSFLPTPNNTTCEQASVAASQGNNYSFQCGREYQTPAEESMCCLNSTECDRATIGTTQQDTVFDLCNQIPDTDPEKSKCIECKDTKAGIWTAVGCINTKPQPIIATIIRIGMGLSGGAAILMILTAAFLFTTSQGDPKRTGQAKELLTSAVIGVVFIIFSVTILQFIGVSILQIPDFGV